PYTTLFRSGRRERGALSLRRGNRSASAVDGSALHLVLQSARLIVATPDRLVCLFDYLAGLRRQVLVAQSRFVFGLDVIFAAFDLVDNGLVVLTHDRLLDIHESPVRGRSDATGILRRAAESGNLGLHLARHLAALLRHLCEELGMRATGVFGSVDKALVAIERGLDQVIQNFDVAVVRHGMVLLIGVGLVPLNAPHTRWLPTS